MEISVTHLPLSLERLSGYERAQNADPLCCMEHQIGQKSPIKSNYDHSVSDVSTNALEPSA